MTENGTNAGLGRRECLRKTGGLAALGLAGLAGCLGFDAPAAGAVDTETLYDETIDSVVTVYVTGADGSSSGSGFVYDDEGRLVTNHHVIDGGEVVEIRENQRTTFTADVTPVRRGQTDQYVLQPVARNTDVSYEEIETDDADEQ